MKKLFLFLIFLILLASPLVSSWDFDNHVAYENKDMTAVIENAFGLPIIGDIIGKMTLTSHTSVNEIKMVMSGGERAVMIYKPSEWNKDTISLGKVKFTNMNTGKEVDKSYYFAEGIYEEVPRFIQVCEPIYDNKIKQEIPYCNQIQDGTYMKRVGWKKLENQNEISKDVKEIALITYVGFDDYYDGVWIVEGKELSRHAVWSSGFNVGLKGYYTFNHTLNDSLGFNNLSVNQGVVTYNAGIINASYWMSGDDSIIKATPTYTLNDTNGWAISMWVNEDSFLSFTPLFNFGVGANYKYLGLHTFTGTDTLGIYGSNSGASWDCTWNLNATFIVGSWNNVVLQWDKTTGNTTLYNNGVLKGSYICSGYNLGGTTRKLNFGEFFTSEDNNFNGAIDEVAIWNRTLSVSEITDLYNSGSGITYVKLALEPGFPISITTTLSSPKDTYSTELSNITFSANATITNGNLTNMTLWIYRQSGLVYSNNLTNFSTGVSNNSFFTEVPVTLGNYIWNVYSCGKNSTNYLCQFASANRTFVILPFIENNITFSNPVQEMSYENFILNATVSSEYTLNLAKLIYNNTQYASTITTSGSNRIISNNIEIPSVNSETIKYFYWNLTISDSESNIYYISSSTSNQTISSIFLGICNATYTINALNFTTKDESDYSLLNNTFNLNLDYYPQTGSGIITKTFLYQNLTENTPYRSLCIYPNTSELTITGIVSYKSTGYDTRTYYFDEYEINNITQNIDLYLALIADSEIVTFAVVDDFDRAVQNAKIVIEKWDIGTGEYLIVNTITTDSEGHASSNLILYETQYRFKIYYNNILYLTDGPSILSTTTKNFKIYFESKTDYSPFIYVEHNLTYTKTTNKTTFKWDGDAAVVTITQGCLVIKNMTNNLNSNIIYNNCFDTSNGEISVFVHSSGTYNALGTVSINDFTGNILTQAMDSLIFSNDKPQRYEIMQIHGQAASFLIIGTVAVIGVAAGSIPLGLGLVTIALFFINWLGFLDLRAFIWSIISLIIVIVVVSVRRKK